MRSDDQTLSQRRRYCVAHVAHTERGFALDRACSSVRIGFAKCDPANGCATCKLAKLPRPGNFSRGRDPKRHQHLEIHAYIYTDICGPFSPPSTQRAAIAT
eukprot:3651833-Pyramimonas_sp.AAC.1